MAFTKLYLGGGLAGYSPATIRGTWVKTTGYQTGQLSHALGFSTANVVAIQQGNGSTLLYRGVSGPLDAQSISGTISGYLGLSYQYGFGGTSYIKMTIYVTQGDSDTPRGNLLLNWVGVTGLPAGGYPKAGLAIPSTAISTLAISAGDRIVIEIGTSGTYTADTDYLYVGGPAVELGSGIFGDMATGVITFSTSLTDTTQVPEVARVTQLPVEVLSQLGTTRVSQLTAEVLTTYLGSARVAQQAVRTLSGGTAGNKVAQVVVRTLSRSAPTQTAGNAIWLGDGQGGMLWID